MRKLGLLVIPLTAVSLLASCGSKTPESETVHKINFDGGEYLSIDTTECKDRNKLLAKISVKGEYLSNYEVPQSEVYYDITCNNKEIKNFHIYSDQGYDSVYLEIPEEEIVGDIDIKTEGYCHYLTFVGEENNAELSYVYQEEHASSPIIQFTNSLDNPNWEPWNDEVCIQLDKNQAIYVRGTINAIHRIRFITGSEESPKISAEGNIMSLLNFGVAFEKCFQGAFSDCGSLIEAPTLPADNLPNNSYYAMFDGCVSLIKAPELPATTAGDYAYSDMFGGCSSLLKAPKMSAISVGKFCCNVMFRNCISLVNGPNVLPATTLANSCYNTMFLQCTALLKAPDLPATTLEDACYQAMFSGCASLIVPPILPIATPAATCYDSMFLNCSSLEINNTNGIKFFECPSDASCAKNMFTNTCGGTWQKKPEPNEVFYYTLDSSSLK